jgi:hypothetical protein
MGEINQMIQDHKLELQFDCVDGWVDSCPDKDQLAVCYEYCSSIENNDNDLCDT